MEHLGARLKQQRESRGIRLEEIASITKIQIQNLRWLEESRWDALPPEPFIRGFLTAYAKYVGLAPQTVIEDYCIEVHKPLKAESARHAENLTAPEVFGTAADQVASKPVITKTRVITGTLAVSLAVIVGVFVTLGQMNERDIAVDNAGNENTAEVDSASSATPSEPNVAGETNPSHKVQLASRIRTWVKVVIDNDEPKDFFMAEGSKLTYAAHEKIKIVIGNSEGTAVLYNGTEAVGTRSASGATTFVYPTGSEFPQDKPVRATSSTAENE